MLFKELFYPLAKSFGAKFRKINEFLQNCIPRPWKSYLAQLSRTYHALLFYRKIWAYGITVRVRLNNTN